MPLDTCKFQTSIKAALVMTSLLLVVGSAGAAEGLGKVCVQQIATGDSWKANDTGASARSIFTVQVDDLAAIHVSTNGAGVFTNLSLTTKHLVKIQLDGKPLTSFRFTFQDRGDHLRLWYSPFYGTWSLADVSAGGRCACSKRTKENSSQSFALPW
jgi:hypothetical protein